MTSSVACVQDMSLLWVQYRITVQYKSNWKLPHLWTTDSVTRIIQNVTTSSGIIKAANLSLSFSMYPFLHWGVVHTIFSQNRNNHYKLYIQTAMSVIKYISYPPKLWKFKSVHYYRSVCHRAHFCYIIIVIIIIIITTIMLVQGPSWIKSLLRQFDWPCLMHMGSAVYLTLVPPFWKYLLHVKCSLKIYISNILHEHLCIFYYIFIFFFFLMNWENILYTFNNMHVF